MFEEFLQHSENSLYSKDQYSEYALGFHIEPTTEPQDFQVALIGVREDRNSINNSGCSEAPDVIRQQLFHLARHQSLIRIADLGNIDQGNTVRDTMVALSKVVNELLRMRILPVIIGGSHEMTFGQFVGYQGLNRNINITLVDCSIDLNNEQGNMDDKNFVLNMLQHQPSYIFNLYMMGYQTHLTSLQALELLEKLQFECFRLGKVQQDITEMEPVFRSTNLCSFDVSAIRFADAPGVGDATPNGLYAEQACQLARYAGQSDIVDSFG